MGRQSLYLVTVLALGLVAVCRAAGPYDLQSTNPNQVLTIHYAPFAICEEDGQINPPGFVTDMMECVNSDLGTDFDVYCSTTSGFTDCFYLVNEDQWPMMLGSYSTKADRTRLADYMINIALSTKALIVPCETQVSGFALFAPMFQPLSVNIFAMMILVHLVLANLVLLTEYVGSSGLRKTVQYSKDGPIMFYMSFMGWDLSKVRTSLGRFILFIDVMLEAVLGAYFIGSVTASTEIGVSVQFDPDSAEDYTVGCREGSTSIDILEEWGAGIELFDSTDACAAMIGVSGTGGVDACLSSYETLAYWVDNNADSGLCLYEESFSPSTRTGAVNFSYPQLRQDMDTVIADMQEDGRLDTLIAKWFEGLDDSLITGNDTSQVQMEWWTYVTIAVLAVFLIVSMLHRLVHQSENRAKKKLEARTSPTARGSESPYASVEPPSMLPV
ncbi:hypothetical protein KIPB_006526 [Kipferlia bialata]|uniref:Solute-binding protein family 3/N-terminal domain-containing protein n=1 Tax=Kipferlia bialata TaxID=797122 RepID=A0A9K3CX64_9EUKA|nr:hypothetical protein KIPB_006526 [Kipferlia bialata]|eukprot:g6526.t1